MASPQIAVIVVCFNLGRTLTQAIESVLQQTLPPSELLIVDDGSTDLYTQQVLQSIADSGHGVLKLSNGGVSAARNRGIARTRAPLFVLLDGDDWLDSQYLEKTAAYLTDHPSCDFVSTGMRGFGASEYVWAPPAPRLVKSITEGVVHSSTLVKRSVWEHVGGYDEQCRAFEELDFWTRVMAAGFAGHVLEEPLLNYRVRSDSLYHTAIDERNHRSLMATFYDKYRDLVRVHFDEFVRRKDAFLVDQNRHFDHISNLVDEAEQRMAALQEQVTNTVEELHLLGAERIEWGQPRSSSSAVHTSLAVEGRSTADYYVQRFLHTHKADVHGRILVTMDVAANREPTDRLPAADILTFDETTGAVRVNGSPIAPNQPYDCVVLSMTTMRVLDVEATIRDVKALTKPYGIVLCALLAMYPLGADEKLLDDDHWRFTETGMRRMFAQLFPLGPLMITSFGNLLTWVAGAHGIRTEDLGIAELDRADSRFPLVYGVRAVNA